MSTITILFGVVLILLGGAGYVWADFASPTALIPAGFGLLLVVFGLLARDEKKRKMAMHIAVVVGLVAFLGTFSGLTQLRPLLSGGAVERPKAVVEKSVTAALTGVYVLLCVKSFIDARRKRAGA